MTFFLEARESLRNFYSKYEVYLTPVFKFVLALITLLTINSKLGYMSKLNNPVIVLIVALMCSFLPTNLITLIAAGFIIGHFYALSLECALIAGVVFLLLFLLYFRFSPKDALVVLLLPICGALKIPYVIPLAVGLVGTPVAVISVASGTIVYFMIEYIRTNATTLVSLDADDAVAKFRYIIDGMMGNKEMLVTLAAFAVTVLLVYLIRRLSVDYAWTIAIVVGAVTCLVILLLGNLAFDVSISVAGMIFGTIGSVLLVKLLQFFIFNVDYSRTEYVQFEDDEYYYYVKAVPKNSLAKTKKTVKKITSVL